jgi:RNA polymerase sigma factor (sigma-70 family)
LTWRSGLLHLRTVDSPRSEASAPPDAALHTWFAEEVQPHEPHLRSYLRRTFPAVHDIDDVVQESYLRMWRQQAAKPMGSARAFLFRVARNFAVDLLRGLQPAAEAGPGGVALEQVADDRAGTFEEVRARELESLLTDALEALTPRHRQVVTLCKLQGRASAEVSTLLGLSEKTVNEHLYRGLQRLGEELRRRGIESVGS